MVDFLQLSCKIGISICVSHYYQSCKPLVGQRSRGRQNSSGRMATQNRMQWVGVMARGKRCLYCCYNRIAADKAFLQLDRTANTVAPAAGIPRQLTRDTGLQVETGEGACTYLSALSTNLFVCGGAARENKLSLSSRPQDTLKIPLTYPCRNVIWNMLYKLYSDYQLQSTAALAKL